VLSAGALAGGCAVTAVAFQRRTASWAHPIVLYYLLWTIVLATDVANPLDMTPLSSHAVGLIATGLGAVALGSLLTLPAAAPASKPETAERVDTVRLLVTVAGLGAVVAFGVLTVVGGLESAAGRPFGTLTAPELRYLSVETGARHLGLGNVAFQITPVLAGLGLVLARVNAAGWLVTAAAVGVTALLPGRLFTLTTLALLVLFAYYQHHGRPTKRAIPRTAVRIAIVIAIAGIGVGYFIYQGERLGKQAYLTSRVPDSVVPTALVPFVVYLTAPPVTFAAALDNSLLPVDDRYRSVWLVPRLAALADPNVKVPETVAGFVSIPFPFNTYTWVADVYWDFGLLGVVVMGFAMGLLVVRVHEWARTRPSLATSWVAACVATFFLSSIVMFRFLWLEAVVLPLVGGVALRLISRPTVSGT